MNVMSVLKVEISRLAKKEANKTVAPVKKANASYRGLIAGLRKQLDSLQKEVSSLKRMAPKAEKVLTKTEPEGRFWITGKGVKAMRKKVGLTQAKFAKLLGVSVPTVVNWEKAKGKLNLRKATAGALQGLRGKGKREVAVMLGEEAGKAPKKVKTPKKAKAVKKAKAKKAKKAPKKAKKAKTPKAKKASKAVKAPKVAKKAKAPKTVEKVEEKPVVETPAEAKKD